jgi:molybdopterin converting factor small subunit
MVVSVNFFGLQRKLTRTHTIQVPLSNKTRVGDILDYVRENYPDLPLSEDTVLITVNNHISSIDRDLRANDQISFIPHIGGG